MLDIDEARNCELRIANWPLQQAFGGAGKLAVCGN